MQMVRNYFNRLNITKIITSIHAFLADLRGQINKSLEKDKKRKKNWVLFQHNLVLVQCTLTVTPQTLLNLQKNTIMVAPQNKHLCAQ